MAFSHRTAVVTGAGGNIGLAICKQFGAAGVRVAAADIRLETAERTADACRALGYDVQAFQQDVTSEASVRESFASILKAFGKIDIVVNNAGVWAHTDQGCRHYLETMPESEWLRILHINLEGTFRCMQQAVLAMKPNKYGRIINLTSIAGTAGLAGAADYSAAKAGVLMLTKVAAMENGKRGITVNSVSPGMVTVKDETAPTFGTWVGRDGLSSEIARAILFLADDDSGFITGVDVPVDGGRTLGCHNQDITSDGQFVNHSSM